jgi:hypothetical protein
MLNFIRFLPIVCLLLVTSIHAQEVEIDQERGTANGATDKSEQLVQQASESIKQMASNVDDSAQAQQFSAGLLQPIYMLAESLEFSAFHWLAFMFMVAGTIGFGLQLVLGKLVALTRSGFSVTEIISDAIGFVVSGVGLVLTTQAAAQNSTFTTSPFAVLSSAALGLVLGILLYIWGQRQELQAIEARRAAANIQVKESAQAKS